jgi:gliding motility-associated-like protein
MFYSKPGSNIRSLKRIPFLKSLMCLLFLTAIFPVAHAQLCTGNLGPVIYEENFGTGSSANSQSATPPSGITTTYAFVGGSNISSGQYALYTNPYMGNTAWYNAPNGDHTQNTNGYMMVIDALTNGVGTFFEKSITASLCPGVNYEFSAWVANIFPNSSGIPPNVTFEIRDAVTNALLGSTSSGNIGYGASLTWYKYALLITAPTSGNPIKLRLLNNYAGSNSYGNDLAIDDITLRACGPQLTVTTAGNKTSYCAGQQATFTVAQGGGAYGSPQYQWQSSPDGTTWTDISGATGASYNTPALTPASPKYYRAAVAQSPNINTLTCRILSNPFIITVNPTSTSTATLSLCPGQLPHTWNGITIPTGATSNAAYTTYTTTNALGCDSVVTLNLTIKPNVTSTKILSLCPGQLPYTWNTTTIPVSATSSPAYATYTTVSAAGCDSTVTLNLTIKPNVTSTKTLSLCPGQLPYTWNTTTIPVGATTNPAYATYTTVNSVGCDSTVTLNLTIKPNVTSTKTLSLCPGQLPYTWNTTTIPVGATTNPAYATFTTVNSAGCDSTVTLNLTIKPNVTSTATLSLCPGQLPYTWNTTTIPVGATTNPAYATFTTVNSAGCDSTVTLNLTIKPNVTSTKTLSLCPGQLPYTWNTTTIPVGATSNPAFATYTTTNVAGCDSTVTLNLTIKPSVTSTATLSLCPGQLPYTWNTTTIPAGATTNPAFATYTTTNSAGCDSTVTLNLTIKPNVTSTATLSLCPGQLPYTWNTTTIPVGATSNPAFATYTTTNVAGCDSTVTLNLTIKPNVTSTATLSLCPGQLPYTWNTTTIPAGATTNPAYATYTTVNSAGCDSTVTLNLTIKPSVTSTATLSLCPGQLPYTWNTTTIPVGATSNPAFATYTTTNVAGCDSTVTLNLTIKPNVTSTKNLSLCPGQLPYTWNITTIPVGATTNPAYATYTTVNSAGCDSTVTLNLTIKPNVTSTKTLSLCPGQLPYNWNTTTIPVGATTNPAYATYTTVNSAGCDSTVTLNLTIKPNVTSTKILSLCPGQLPYTWNTTTIPVGATTNPAYATFTTVNSAGCDSTVTLNLTIKPNVTSTATLSLCPGQLPYTWNTTTIPAGATTNPAYATYTTANSVGCDSTVTLNLTIKPNVSTTKTLSLCPGQLPYTWNGITIPAGATTNPAYTTYTTPNSVGCDSTVTLNLTIKPSVTSTAILSLCPGQLPYTWNTTTIPAGASSNTAYATYTTQNIAGCDSVVTLNLTIKPNVTSTAILSLCTAQLPYTWNTTTIPVGAATNAVYATYTTSSAAGCDSTVTLNLTIKPNVTNTVSAKICYGESYHFGSQTLIATGTYVTTFPAANACDSTVTLHLTVKAQAVTQTINLSGCSQVVFEGQTYFESTQLNKIFKDIDGCDSTIRTVYIIVNQPYADTVKADICVGDSYMFNGHSYNTTGWYHDVFSGVNGCDSTTWLQLTVHELPLVSLSVKNQPRYCIGDTVSVTAQGAMLYEWKVNDHDFPGTEATIDIPTRKDINLVWVKGSDQYGCADTANITVKAEPCCAIFTPNAFTPNGDGNNDGFGPETNGHPENYAMKIYNRFGQMVFVSYKINQKWDGTQNGQPVESGTYFYLITGDCVSGAPIQLKGDITLIR